MDYLQSADYLKKSIQHIEWRESLLRGGLEFSIGKATGHTPKSPALDDTQIEFTLEGHQ
ncbi:hypothetical protein OQ486_16225 [Plesiomonas shigelloides]|uniref:hypothetical protein n=1 Tax=Plesiomonas shigelloides TaxID=703 RepID=UPI0022480EE8|nr:hypothetical protein [Plesiomonas shigelloides]MCX2534992.1 hypothetical protein [Plesiomonas shigelloides]